MKYSLEVYNLSKKIKNKYILNTIGFKVRKDSIYGIVGSNGSGKTTLLRIITGLYKQSTGFIKINNIVFENNNEKVFNKVAALIESPKFYENLTGRENLELVNILYENKYNVQNIIDKMDISSYIDKKVKNMSLGMKQKIAIASLLLIEPQILILDEPTNGFDPGEVIKFIKLIKSLKNTTVIICTHDLNIIESVCDEVLFLKNGRLIDIKKGPFTDKKELEMLFKEKYND